MTTETLTPAQTASRIAEALRGLGYGARVDVDADDLSEPEHRVYASLPAPDGRPIGFAVVTEPGRFVPSFTKRRATVRDAIEAATGFHATRHVERWSARFWVAEPVRQTPFAERDLEGLTVSALGYLADAYESESGEMTVGMVISQHGTAQHVRYREEPETAGLHAEARRLAAGLREGRWTLIGGRVCHHDGRVVGRGDE